MGNLVYYWKGSADAREDLMAALRERSLNVQVKRTLEELLEGFHRERPWFLLVDASGGDRESSQRVVELSTTPEFFQIPVVFVSTSAEKRTDSLSAHFKKVLPITVPFRLDAVLKILETVFDIPKKPDSQILKATLKDASLAEPERNPETISSEASPAATTRRPRRRLAENTPYIRERMRKNPDPANLQTGHGGEVFAIANSAEDFVDSHLLPTSNQGNVQELLEGLGKDDAWLLTHSKRLSFVSAAVTNSLKLGKERDRTMRISSLFLNWALRDRPLELSRYDRLRKPSPELSLVLAESYAQSARFVQEQLGEERASKTIQLVSDFLTDQVSQASGESRQDAEILYSLETAGRACWGLGFWEPAGAYRAIGYFRSNPTFLSDPSVRNAMIKVLGEAVTVHVTVGNIFVPAYDLDEPSPLAQSGMAQANLLRKAELATLGRTSVTVKEKKTVSLKDLSPGMLLMEPLHALDGRIILDANVILNEELLFHLWQLAAIRALRAKVDVAVAYSEA